jgi:hypothetical protein
MIHAMNHLAAQYWHRIVPLYPLLVMRCTEQTLVVTKVDKEMAKADA